MATLLQLIASRLDKLKSIVYSLYPVRLCFGLINTDITSIHSKHRTKAGRVDKNCALKANPCFCLIGFFCFKPYLLLLSHIWTTLVFESELILNLRFDRYKKAIPFTVMLNEIRPLKEKMGMFYKTSFSIGIKKFPFSSTYCLQLVEHMYFGFLFAQIIPHTGDSMVSKTELQIWISP